MQQITIEKFGGLNLNVDPAAIGLEGATEALNVELALDRSLVRKRRGTEIVAIGLNAFITRALAPIQYGTTEYILGAGTVSGSTVGLDRIAADGTRINVGSWAAGSPSGSPCQIVTFGTPTASLGIVAWPDTPLRQYDGSSLTTLPGAPRYIATTTQSNRLVQGGFALASNAPTGANGSLSTVFFSDAGSPNVYGANNYVHLQPGDGEEITGMTTWRDLLFVFKESRAFIFYGESTDSTGQPVFNFRQITLSSPVDRSVSDRVRVGTTNKGVYYLATNGVYVTTGGQPTKVSQPIDGFQTSSSGGCGHLSATGSTIFVQKGAALSGPTSERNVEFYVYNEEHGQWLEWRFATPVLGCPLTVWPAINVGLGADQDGFVFVANQTLHRSSPNNPSDSGTITPSRYRTGVSDLGDGSQRVIREMLVDGSGNVRAGIGVDWGANPVGTPMALGLAPAVTQGRARDAVRGRNFRVQIDAASGAWAVNRMQLNVRSQRPIGVKQ